MEKGEKISIVFSFFSPFKLNMIAICTRNQTVENFAKKKPTTRSPKLNVAIFQLKLKLDDVLPHNKLNSININNAYRVKVACLTSNSGVWRC